MIAQPAARRGGPFVPGEREGGRVRSRFPVRLLALCCLCAALVACEKPCRKYVAVGDSITAGSGDGMAEDGRGYVDVLKLFLPNATFYNEGIGETTLDQWANDGLLERALDRHPNACGVLVILGINDMWSAARKQLKGKDAERDFRAIRQDFGTLERKLKGRRLRAWLSTFPTPYAGGPFARANGIIRDVQRSSRYFRPGPDLARMFDGLDFYFIPDKVHPNAYGYVAIGAAWVDLLDPDHVLRRTE